MHLNLTDTQRKLIVEAVRSEARRWLDSNDDRATVIYDDIHVVEEEARVVSEDPILYEVYAYVQYSYLDDQPDLTEWDLIYPVYLDSTYALVEVSEFPEM